MNDASYLSEVPPAPAGCRWQLDLKLPATGPLLRWPSCPALEAHLDQLRPVILKVPAALRERRPTSLPVRTPVIRTRASGGRSRSRTQTVRL